MNLTCQSETESIARVMVKHAREAFRDQGTIAAQWHALNFAAPPDFAAAVDEYEHFLDLLRAAGAEILTLARGEHATLDSIYVRDASVMCDRGAILCRMGKPQRAGEPVAERGAFEGAGVAIAGSIETPGTLEGGDVVWLDRHTLAVGRGYRTNDEGIRQLRSLVGDAVEVIAVPLPHWRGAGDVFHLMSIISPIDHDVAVVYAPLMPIPFRERLIGRGMTLVEVPDEEFRTMGANVLAVGPGRCVTVAGNPRTRAALERAGAEVIEYAGREISLKGGGGPTCLTRPIERGAM